MKDKVRQQIESTIAEIAATEKKTGANWAWVKLPMTPQECSEAFQVFLDRQVAKRKPGEKFTIDIANQDTLEQVVAYMTGSPDFRGDHHKGLMIIGNFGTGKTTIVNAMCEFYLAMRNRVIHSISSVELTAAVRKGEKAVEFYSQKPLFIDEIGRETEKVNDYGTEIRPIADILSIRYAKGALTFATSNFVVEKVHAKGGLCLEDKYGTYISDRMREMFNIIVMRGESRRR
jgi:DNA replication protein DnaC